jgi:hypothetical protein
LVTVSANVAAYVEWLGAFASEGEICLGARGFSSHATTVTSANERRSDRALNRATRRGADIGFLSLRMKWVWQGRAFLW